MTVLLCYNQWNCYHRDSEQIVTSAHTPSDCRLLISNERRHSPICLRTAPNSTCEASNRDRCQNRLKLEHPGPTATYSCAKNAVRYCQIDQLQRHIQQTFKIGRTRTTHMYSPYIKRLVNPNPYKDVHSSGLPELSYMFISQESAARPSRISFRYNIQHNRVQARGVSLSRNEGIVDLMTREDADQCG